MNEEKFIKQFVTYNVAVKLKELEYNEDCLAQFLVEEERLQIFSFDITGKTLFEMGFKRGWSIKAPLWQEVIDWFRIKYELFIEISTTFDQFNNGYRCEVKQINKRGLTCLACSGFYSKIYEDGREEAILKAIKKINKTK